MSAAKQAVESRAVAEIRDWYNKALASDDPEGAMSAVAPDAEQFVLDVGTLLEQRDELLAACESVCEWAESARQELVARGKGNAAAALTYAREFEQLRAAIAKAKGGA